MSGNRQIIQSRTSKLPEAPLRIEYAAMFYCYSGMTDNRSNGTVDGRQEPR
jgi:hypothetical protein